MAQPISHPTAAGSYRNIQNTLATYCIALDTKNWSLLNEVFIEDVEAVYPFSSETIHGVDALAARIKARLTPVDTQHALTTQHLTLHPGAKTASSTTYFTGVHLGRGKWAGQMVTAYGKYVDELVYVEDGQKWLVKRREVSFMGRIGEEGVMEGE